MPLELPLQFLAPSFIHRQNSERKWSKILTSDDKRVKNEDAGLAGISGNAFDRQIFVYPVNKRIIFAETDEDCGVREQRDNACLNLEY